MECGRASWVLPGGDEENLLVFDQLVAQAAVGGRGGDQRQIAGAVQHHFFQRVGAELLQFHPDVGIAAHELRQHPGKNLHAALHGDAESEGAGGPRP